MHRQLTARAVILALDARVAGGIVPKLSNFGMSRSAAAGVELGLLLKDFFFFFLFFLTKSNLISNHYSCGTNSVEMVGTRTTRRRWSTVLVGQ